MLYDDTNKDTDTIPEEELDDEEATLADDVLDEVDDEDDDFSTTEDDETDDTDKTKELTEDDEDEDELGSTLEADAEEVDFDSFDDLDEM